MDESNPYLELGFLQFAIVSTLMIVLFPWSLLFCLWAYGLDETALIVQALIADAVRTILGLISIIFGLVTLALIVIFVFAIGADIYREISATIQ